MQDRNSETMMDGMWDSLYWMDTELTGEERAAYTVKLEALGGIFDYKGRKRAKEGIPKAVKDHLRAKLIEEQRRARGVEINSQCK